MKKIIFSAISILGISLLLGGQVLAQGMMSFSTSSLNSASVQSQQQEEQEGKKLLDDLNNKTIACSQITDSDFDKIGEYFMGQSIGNASKHIAMNEMMKRMMGEKGEEQMHIAWGKRGSGCDNSSPANNSIMNFEFTPFGAFGWIFMVLWWVLIIAGIIALIKWLMERSRGARDHKRSPLEILKERYAKGEINKKEFEDKKKDLN